MNLTSFFLLVAMGFSIPKSSHEKVSPASSGIKLPAVRKAEAQSFRKEAERIAAEIRKDHRRPTRKNLSGRWIDGSGFTPFSSQFLQLEQNGEKISGRGYDSSCGGLYCAFRVTGTYRNSTLHLTVIRRNQEINTQNYILQVIEKEGYPRLVDSTAADTSFQTNFEMQKAY